MVRVLVADDHPVYREGVARAISDRAGLELVGVAADGREAMAGIRELTPDVAVLDVRMPGLSGIDVVAEIARERLPTRVLLLSAQSDEQLIFDGVSVGASGYLLKDSDRSDICAAVEAIAAGRAVLAPEAQTALAQGVRIRGAAQGPAISDREREVLALTADGLSAPQIGARLHLSPATVKSHLQNVYEKLGVSDRAAAVATAIRLGLLE
ncbi:MAG TPA: response regulator transcription factor [Miltoncostaea sp.]|jgi:two-component system nitrate/nitrite response regulator NarL|nr:response regulator transcription factor [Miltoncostaea sp.]